MVQLNLFGDEATAIVQTIQAKKRGREKEKDLSELKWEIHNEQKRIEELKAQDETGWDEFKKSIQGKDVNIKLCEAHISYYKKQIAEKRAAFQPILEHWRTFIEKLCQERSQAIDLIWFDTSSPYDCEINVRMKNHKCWSSCVSFRFKGDKLEAYDSHFGGGTSFVEHLHQTHIDRMKVVTEVMERVFAGDCTNSGWDSGEHGHREIKIDEMGWNDNEVLK